MRKQMEGDNEERRSRAREARESGSSAGEAGASTGASKQHRDAQNGEDRLDARTHGKSDPEHEADNARPDRGPHDNS